MTTSEREASGYPRSLRKAYLRAGRFKVYREQISSLYIYGYGLFRRLFLLTGKEMVTRGILDKADDIFYLTRDEIKVILDSRNSDRACDYRISCRKPQARDGRDEGYSSSCCDLRRRGSVARDGKEQESIRHRHITGQLYRYHEGCEERAGFCRSEQAEMWSSFPSQM
ncbi:MAG: hypothetical protein MZV63_61075 [Marinilabiliales bacterium]|nr:hypothetical protein [Marinilabiliales bacterium]